MILSDKRDKEAWIRERTIESMKNNTELINEDLVLVAENNRFYKVTTTKTDISLQNNLYAYPLVYISDNNHNHTPDQVGLGNVNNYHITTSHTTNSNQNYVASNVTYELGRGIDGDVFNKVITIDGDADTYYPVSIRCNYRRANLKRLHISRKFNDPAPDSWNTSIHKGSLTLCVECVGDGNWSGDSDSIRVIHYFTQYSKPITKMIVGSNNLIFWLRGGGATYTIGSDISPSYLNIKVNMEKFIDSNKDEYFPQSFSQEDLNATIFNNYPIRKDSNAEFRNMSVRSTTNLYGNSIFYQQVEFKPDAKLIAPRDVVVPYDRGLKYKANDGREKWLICDNKGTEILLGYSNPGEDVPVRTFNEIYAARNKKVWHEGNLDPNNIDASKITSGTIDIARLPAGALERLVEVDDDTDRFNLTKEQIQLGDVVKVKNTLKMYKVINDNKLNTEDGYTVFVAGRAAEVPWSGITDKPDTFPSSSHNHDERYDTKEEINNKLNQKVNISESYKIKPKSIGSTTENTDFNDLYEPGFYYSQIFQGLFSNGFLGVESQPYAEFTLIVLGMGANPCLKTQYAVKRDSREIYIRSCTAWREPWTWSEWEKLPNMKDITWNNLFNKPVAFPPIEHNHTKEQITDFPSSLKNPYDLTISLNGSSQGAYDGSSAKSINITPTNIGTYNKSEIDSLLNGKANTSHGNHVPSIQSANNAIFLRNDNQWATVTPSNIGTYTKNEIDDKLNKKSDVHSHPYLSLSGGTMSGTIIAKNSSTNWIGGKDNGCILTNVDKYEFSSGIIMKSTNKTFSFGSLGDTQAGIYMYNNSETNNLTNGSLYLDLNGNGHCTGTFIATKIHNAVWNDYAELFERGESTEAGDIIALDISSTKEQYIKADSSSKRVIGVHSDTYGHLIGGEKLDNYEDNFKKFIPIGLAGRVNVKVKGKVQLGDYIVPSDEKGIGRVYNKDIDDRDMIIGYLVEADEREDIRRLKIFIN